MATVPEQSTLAEPGSSNGTDPLRDTGNGSLGLVNLGWVPWGRSWKRNQSMVYQLSRSALFDRTVFVNPRGLWLAEQFRPDEGGLRDRFRRFAHALPRRHDSDIRICSQWHFLPFKRMMPGIIRLEDWLFLRSVRGLLGGRPYVLLNNHPNFESPRVLRRLMAGARLRVFDLSDDFVEYFTDEEHRALFLRNLEFCCSRSDMVFAINQHVADKYRRFNENMHVVPNSTNFDNFHRDSYREIPLLTQLKASGAPTFGCTGIINRIRIDYQLVEHLARSRPQWHFVFVGSADRSFIDLAGRFDNVHHHPQVPYEELPDWIDGFDAVIIPFQVNEHTAGNDLLKFHDYLAMGKNVVTTNTGGAWKFEGLLDVAHDVDEFVEGAERALRPPSEELVARRMEMARANSWNFRAQQIEAILREHLEEAARC